MSNRQLIKMANVAAFAVLLLSIVVAVAKYSRPSGSSTQQNSNSSRSQNANSNSNNRNSSNENAANSNSRGQTQTRTAKMDSQDKKFLMDAAIGGMMEVELGRIATQKGMSDAVKQFGQRMVDDHSRANTELMQLAASKGVTVPTALDQKHRDLMNKLSSLSGAEFDRAYAKAMAKDHSKDVSTFQKQSTRSGDADIKAFAAKTLPTLQEHLQMARELERSHGNTRANSNNSNR